MCSLNPKLYNEYQKSIINDYILLKTSIPPLLIFNPLEVTSGPSRTKI